MNPNKLTLAMRPSVEKQFDDDLARLVAGASDEPLPSEAFHNVPVLNQAPVQLPKLISLAKEKYATNSNNTIYELRNAAANMRAVADELEDAAAQIEKDQPFFSDTITKVVEYEIECSERVKRYLLIKPTRG